MFGEKFATRISGEKIGEAISIANNKASEFISK